MLDFTRKFGDGEPDRAMIGRTRVGLHYGEAIVGNFGGEGRISYTALGDSMNTAARLEGANKYLKSKALVSDEVRKLVDTGVLRPMGRIVLSGRPTPIVVWEPAPDVGPEMRRELDRLGTQFDTGDKEALHAIEAIAAAHPDDPLCRVCHRLLQAGPGGHFVLGEKCMNRWILAGCALAISMGAVAAEAAVLVVRSSGPSSKAYPAGKAFPRRRSSRSRPMTLSSCSICAVPARCAARASSARRPRPRRRRPRRSRPLTGQNTNRRSRVGAVRRPPSGATAGRNVWQADVAGRAISASPTRPTLACTAPMRPRRSG